MKPCPSSPPPEIDDLFVRLKDEMTGARAASLNPVELEEKLNKFHSAYKKALVQRNDKVITVMGMRIEQYVDNMSRTLDPDQAVEERRDANRDFNVIKIACEALVDEWNENRWVYSKSELIQRAIALLSSTERQGEILQSFTMVLPNGNILQPTPGALSSFMKDAISYLRREMENDNID